MKTTEKKLYRLPKEGMIAGVAAGFAKYFDIDVTIVRLLFVVAGLVTAGSAIIAYIILAIIMPTPDRASIDKRDVGEKIENLVEEVRDNGRARRLGNYAGFGLIVLGAWLMLGQIFPAWFNLQWSLLWPALLIIIGAWIIIGGKGNE
ncbi:MAG: PspC domain-containing protein [Candidatus Saccharimonadaceae bacterium]